MKKKNTSQLGAKKYIHIFFSFCLHIQILYCLTLKFLKNAKLYFSVPPDEVTILGPSEVKTDLTYVYRCEAKNANPAPKIQWIVNGMVTTTGVSTQTHPPPPRPSGFVPYDHSTGQSNKSVYSYLVVHRRPKYLAEVKVFCYLAFG